jgi:hypothetical protein
MGYFCNFWKTAQSKLSPIGRNFAQCGHPGLSVSKRNSNTTVFARAGSGLQNAGSGRARALHCRLGLFAGLGANLVKMCSGLGFLRGWVLI